MRIRDWSSDVCSSDLRKTDTSGRCELDQTSAALLSPLTLYEHAQQFSQEIQFSRQTDNYDLIIGGYYFQEKLHGGVAMPASNIYLPIFFGVPIEQEYLNQGYFAGSNLDTRAFAEDRKSVGSGKGGAIRVVLGGPCFIKKK